MINRWNRVMSVPDSEREVLFKAYLLQARGSGLINGMMFGLVIGVLIGWLVL